LRRPLRSGSMNTMGNGNRPSRAVRVAIMKPSEASGIIINTATGPTGHSSTSSCAPTM
jgi:hypothetical protein